MTIENEFWLRPFRLPDVELPDALSYDNLADYGARYESTMSEINRAGLDAQRRHELSADRKLAWRQLRDADKRLLLDFLHIQTSNAAFGGEPGPPHGVPSIAPPVLRLPEVADPSPQHVIDALGSVEPPAVPDFDPGPPPPLVADLWELLEELLPAPPSAPPELPEPTSFLEDLM